MTTIFIRQISRMVFIAAAAGLLGGCATSGNPKDPIEGFNRAMFGDFVIEEIDLPLLVDGFEE